MSALLLWRGPSRFDGSRITASIVTRTNNRKTGQIPALWIEPERQAALCPQSICGDCPQRNGGCYVSGAPIWTVRAGLKGQRRAPWSAVEAALVGQTLRLGAHGDPAALPARLVLKVCRLARHVLGYTHAWRRGDAQWLRPWCMASIESPQDVGEALALGWRYYRIVPSGADLLPGEIDCPAVTHKVTCAQCRLCGGAGKRTGKAPSIVIEAHGSGYSKVVTA